MQDYYFYIYLAVINIITFWVYGEDKRRAQKGRWRIGERTLLILAFLGGSVGALMGMYVFRHKTKKVLFRIGIPCIILFHVAVLCIWK